VVSLKKKYVNGLLDGEFIQYNINGKVEKKEIKINGETHGESNIYYDNGVIRQTLNYVDGVPSGESIFYNLKGKMFRKETYKNGKLNGPTILYNTKNGEIKSQQNYVNGVVQP